MKDKLKAGFAWFKKQDLGVQIGMAAALLACAVIAAGLMNGVFGGRDYRDAIRAVIAQDRQLSDDAFSGRSIWEYLAGANPDRIDRLVANMHKIDLRRCPSDFQSAYREHVNAWSSIAIAHRANRDTSFAGEKVRTTWHTVNDIASKYGAGDAIR